MPLVGNVEISIIEEANPRLLTFKEGRTDYEFVGRTLIGNVVQNGKLAPIAPKGIRHQRAIDPALAYDYFNLEDPVVGGMTPDRIALPSRHHHGVPIG